jgi:hypothetical protein
VAQSVAWPLRGDGGAATVDLEHAVAEIDGVVLRYGRFYDPGTYFEHAKPPHPRVHIDDAARRTVEALFMAEPGVLADRRVGFAPPLGTWGLATLAMIRSVSVENEPTPVGPTVDEIAAEGGWMVEDPRGRHDRNPETFWLPDDSLRRMIGPGSQVRLLIWFIDETGAGRLVPQRERMWAVVEAREGDLVRGRLASPPLSARAALVMGELIQFRPTDAIDVLDAENDWQEHRSFLEAIFEGDEGFEEWKRAHPHKLEPKA